MPARPLRDFTLQFSLDPNSTTPIRLVVPDNARLIEVFAVRNAALSAQAVISFTSSLGTLTVGLVLPTGGGAGTINSQDYVVDAPGDASNFFTRGTQFTATSGGGPAGGVTVQFVAVFRP